MSKELNVENWMEPDPRNRFWVVRSHRDGSERSLTGSDWASQVLGVTLEAKVPEEIRKLYQRAQAVVLYGYFFYPLWTEGSEKLFLVLEAAVSEKCKGLGAPKSLKTLEKKIQWLIDKGHIDAKERVRWEATRSLRNSVAHPERASLHMPTDALMTLDVAAKQINDLFR